MTASSWLRHQQFLQVTPLKLRTGACHLCHFTVRLCILTFIAIVRSVHDCWSTSWRDKKVWHEDHGRASSRDTTSWLLIMFLKIPVGVNCPVFPPCCGHGKQWVSMKTFRQSVSRFTDFDWYEIPCLANDHIEKMHESDLIVSNLFPPNT